MNSKRSRKKEGVLQVKLSSRSALGKAWKRKWVVVQQNTSSSGKSLLLELYVEKGAYHKTVTSLLLEGVVGVRRTRSKTQDHAIEISSDSKVLLGVGAESETDAQEWLSMFRMNLLPPVKEMQSPPGIPEDFVRVSVIPNKDSERVSLSGDYFAHISLTHINLYDTCTGKIALDWDLRHLKKFMLISKCHQLDFEKIVHIMTSKRSVSGEGEFIFFSPKGKELVEGLYERLSNAMTVKSRRSRSTSMLFEITAQELEQMFKDADQPPEETLKEDEREEAEANGETVGEVNGSVPEGVPSSNRVDTDGKDGTEATEVVEQTPDEEQGNGVKTNEMHDEKQSDETLKQEKTAPEIDENKDVANEVVNDEDASNTTAHDAEVAQQLEIVSSQDEDIVKDSEEKENERVAEDSQEDDKCIQTNPDEMDIGIQASTGPVDEQPTPPDAVVHSDPKGPEELDAGLNQGNEQGAAFDQMESTTDAGAGVEQSSGLKDPTGQDGQSQLSSTVGVVDESVIVVPTIENTQETANLEPTQPTPSAAIIQDSAESQAEETKLDGEKADVHGKHVQESTTDAGAGVEQSSGLKDPTGQDGQSQLSSTVGVVDESVIVVPTIENTQETANLEPTQPTPSAAIIQAESQADETKLDGEKADVQVINVSASKDQQEVTEPDTEQQQALAEPVLTDAEADVKEPVNTDAEKVTEAETERIATTEEHSDKDIQKDTEETEEQSSNEVRETEMVDSQHGTNPEEHSKIEKQETTVADQERSTAPVGESIITESEPGPSTVSDKEHVATSVEKNNEATSEQTEPVIVSEHEPSTDDLPKESETDVAEKAVEDTLVVTPDVSATDAVPKESDGSVDKEVESPDTETSTKYHEEVANESISEVNSSSETKSDTESSSELPQKSPLEGNENREDELNSNQNNSNTDTTGERKISKTIPLPNSLTSRMASALRNAQKRKVSGTSSPSQETQTEFPSEGHHTDDTAEIIV